MNMKLCAKVIAFITVVYLSTFLCSYGQNRQYMKDASKGSWIIAHAGGQGLAPSNNMLAFDVSDAIGVDMLEMDVLLTKDSVLVLHHNETIDSKTTGSGFVKDYTLAELRQFNYGYSFRDTLGNYPYRDSMVLITTLEEILQKYGEKYPMCIELKNKDAVLGKKAAEELLRLLTQYKMKDKVIVSCFDDSILGYFRKISQGKIITGMGKSETKKFVLLNMFFFSLFYNDQSGVMQLPVESSGQRLDSKKLLRSAHAKSIAVQYWTINNPEEMKRLIKLGADGIITDRPDLMKRVLAEIQEENNFSNE